MNGVAVGIDLSAIDGYFRAVKEAPDVLMRELADAYGAIARLDVDTLRGGLAGRLNIRSRGLAKSFKGRATDRAKATDLSKLFATVYTGWKAAEIFETGGTIAGKGKSLTVLTSDARGAGGRRKYTQRQLMQLVASKQVRFVPTPRGVLIVQDVGGLTGTGKTRKNSRSVVLGILKRTVTERKRLDFFANAERNGSLHQEFLEYAVENTLAAIAAAAQE